ncbi:MAG: nuclear transport factor 2 family protein [Actinomycetes bacterium]
MSRRFGDSRDREDHVTPADLCDIEAIKQTKYAYLRCIDQKDWVGLVEVFWEDATASYSGGNYEYEGRDAIVAFITQNMGREQFHSSHRVHHPEIALSGDRATGTWALEDTVLDTEWKFLLQGAAFYNDVYERRAGEWRILHTGYRRSFEYIVPTESINGFTVTASWWGTDGRSTLPVQ